MRFIRRFTFFCFGLFLVLGLSIPSSASDEKLQTQDHTVTAYPAQFGEKLEQFDPKTLIGGRHKRSEMPFSLLPDSALPETTPDHDSRVAYIIHFAEWNSVNGAYSLARSTWYVYRAVCLKHPSNSCEFVRTGFKADGKSPLIYGYRTIWLLGVTHFATPIDPTGFSSLYKVSTTPGVAQNIQDLGALLSAVIGATPAAVGAAPALGGAAKVVCAATPGQLSIPCLSESNSPLATDTLISLARIRSIDKLPFVVNFNYLLSLNQLGGLPTGREGSVYSATLSPNGGNGNYSFRIVHGSLPTGLSIDPNSGSIAGTVVPGSSGAGAPCIPVPATAASNAPSCDWHFTIQVSDGSNPPNNTLVPGVIRIQSSTILQAAPTNLSPGSGTAPGVATNSSTVALRWNASSATTSFEVAVKDVASGAFAEDSTVNSTSFVTSHLAAGRQYVWNVDACDASGCSSFSSPAYFQTPAAGVVPPPPPVAAAIPPAARPAAFTLPAAVINKFYSSGIGFAGQDGTYTYSLQGRLPNGLALDPTTGTVSGVPVLAGTYSFSIVVKGASAGAGTPPPSYTFDGTVVVSDREPDLKFDIVSKKLIANYSTLHDATLGRDYSAAVSASGPAGTGPFQYKVTLDKAKGESWPIGLAMSGGVFSGVPISWDPSVHGLYSFTINITDTSTGNVDKIPVTLRVDLPTTDVKFSETPDTAVVTLPPGSIQMYYLAGITEDGSSVATSLAGGGLPNGVGLSSSGVIMGTPTVGGNFEFTVKLTNSKNQDLYKTFRLVVGKSVIAAVFGTAAPANPSGANRGPADSATTAGGTPGKNPPTGPGGNGPPNSLPSNNSQNAGQPNSQSVDCSAVTSSNPCSFTDSFQSDDRELWDVSVGLAIPGPYERKYSATNPSMSSLTRHTDAYGLVDIYLSGLWFWGSRDSLTGSWVPHFNFGIPLTSQPLYRPYFGLSECITTWTRLEAHGFPIRINVFAGFVDMKQQIAVTQTGGEVIFKTDRALKPMFGIEVPISSIVSKITGGKSKGGGGSANATGASAK